MVGSHIQLLRDSLATPRRSWPTVDQLTVVPYHKLSKKQVVAFEVDAEQLQHVYAAIEKGIVIQYFVYEHDRISSFAYITKGKEGPHYFIGY
jgi:hypothetical protein